VIGRATRTRRRPRAASPRSAQARLRGEGRDQPPIVGAGGRL